MALIKSRWIRYIILSVFSITLMASCVSTNFMTIDIREPAYVTLPPEIVNVTVVDNSYIAEKDKIEALFKKEDDETIVYIDSTQNQFSTLLVQYMNEEGFFNQVVFYPNFRHGADSLFTPMPAERIENICKETGSDALISIDQGFIYGSLSPVLFGYSRDSYLLKTNVMELIKAYKSDGTPLFEPIVIVDSIYTGIVYAPEKDTIKLEHSSDIQNGLSYTATITADKLTNMFIPHWEAVERLYYSDNSSEMKEAAKLAKEFKWTEAALIWGNLYEKEEKPIKKVRLAHNIALANECLNDIDNALLWNEIATDLLSEIKGNSLVRQDVKDQKRILTDRKNKVEKLAEQYGEE